MKNKALVGWGNRYENNGEVAIALHAMRPVVDKVFAWTEARAALEHLRSGNHFGKVVLKF